MSVSLKQSYDIEYDGTANVARMDLFVDTAADLTGLTTFDSITLLQGSTAEDISTGDKYAMQTNGTWVKQPSNNAFANVYTKSEIDSMLYLYYTKTEADALFEWITVTITTDTLPLQFIADGSPLTVWAISGNGQQTGTPTPSAPIMPEECGDLVETGEHAGEYAIPITCDNTTQTIYLSDPIRKIGTYVDTVSSDGTVIRRNYKYKFTGTENIQSYAQSQSGIGFYIGFLNAQTNMRTTGYCSHFKQQLSPSGSTIDGVTFGANNTLFYFTFSAEAAATLGLTDTASIKQWLSEEYTAGHPVTILYVMSGTTAETVTAPTITPSAGENTLTAESELQPSEITIIGKIREVTENEQ